MLTKSCPFFTGFYNCFNSNRGGDAKLVMQFFKAYYVVSILFPEANQSVGFKMDSLRVHINNISSDVRPIDFAVL